MSPEPDSRSRLPDLGESIPSLPRNRNFGLYLAGNVASWAGLGVADVLLLWLVYARTDSVIDVAFLGIVEALPPIAIGLFAGVLADRYDRRRIIVWTTAMQGVVLGLILLSIRMFGFQLGLALVLVVGLETVTVVFRPASTAILPSLVRSESLDNANALTEAATSVATTVGSAGAAVLLILVGTDASFGVNIGIFAVGALLLWLMASEYARSPDAPPGRRPPSFRRDLVEAVRFLRDRPALLELTAVTVAAGFFVTIFSPFLVVYTVQELNRPASWFGYLLGGYTGGFFVGSLLVPRLRVVRFYGRSFALAMLLGGGLLATLVVLPSFLLALLSLGALGALLGVVITGFVTLAQRIVPSELLGRYLGLDEMLTWTVAPLGIVAGGLLTQALGIRVSFAVSAVGLVGVGVVSLLRAGVRSIGYVPPRRSATPGAAESGQTDGTLT
jgi:MFS family permease